MHFLREGEPDKKDTVMKFYSYLKLSLFLSVLLPCFDTAYAREDYFVKISLDSAHLLMGKQTDLHIEIGQPSHGEDARLLLPNDTLTKNVEIIDVLGEDTISNSSQTFIKKDILIQSFDSGLYPIGPLKLLTPSGDTIYSNRLSLKVIPVDVDSLETIHSFAPVQKANSKWWDFIPDFILDYWIYLIIMIIIIVAGFVIWLMAKKKIKVPFIPQPKPVSPYQMALESLDILRDKHLCEQGREKEYYTELTDILRRYLESRFGINAMEMTSSQILKELQNSEVARHHYMIKRILEIADFVKFAKVRPLPSDNVAVWNNAREFVIDTKPDDSQSSSNENIGSNDEINEPNKNASGI